MLTHYSCADITFVIDLLQGASMRVREALPSTSGHPPAAEPAVLADASPHSSRSASPTILADITSATGADALIDQTCARAGEHLIDISAHIALLTPHILCPCKRAAAREAAVAAVPTQPTAAAVPESGAVAMEVVDDPVPAHEEEVTPGHDGTAAEDLEDLSDFDDDDYNPLADSEGGEDSSDDPFDSAEEDYFVDEREANLLRADAACDVAGHQHL